MGIETSELGSALTPALSHAERPFDKLRAGLREGSW